MNKCPNCGVHFTHRPLNTFCFKCFLEIIKPVSVKARSIRRVAANFAEYIEEGMTIPHSRKEAEIELERTYRKFQELNFSRRERFMNWFKFSLMKFEAVRKLLRLNYQ